MDHIPTSDPNVLSKVEVTSWDPICENPKQPKEVLGPSNYVATVVDCVESCIKDVGMYTNSIRMTHSSGTSCEERYHMYKSVIDVMELENRLLKCEIMKLLHQQSKSHNECENKGSEQSIQNLLAQQETECKQIEQEKKQLEEERNQMVQDQNKLRSDQEKLLVDQEKHSHEKQQLDQSHQELQKRIEEMEENQSSLQKKHTQMDQEQAALSTDQNNLEIDRKTFMEVKELVEREKEMNRKGKEQLEHDQEMLRIEREKLNREWQELKKEQVNVKTQHDQLANDELNLRKLQEEQKNKQETLNEDRRQFELQQDRIKQEHASTIQNMQNDLHRQEASLRSTQEHIEQMKSRVSEDERQLEQDRQQLKNEMCAFMNEKQQFQNEKEVMEAKKTQLESELTFAENMKKQQENENQRIYQLQQDLEKDKHRHQEQMQSALRAIEQQQHHIEQEKATILEDKTKMEVMRKDIEDQLVSITNDKNQVEKNREQLIHLQNEMEESKRNEDRTKDNIIHTLECEIQSLSTKCDTACSELRLLEETVRQIEQELKLLQQSSDQTLVKKERIVTSMISNHSSFNENLQRELSSIRNELQFFVEYVETQRVELSSLLFAVFVLATECFERKKAEISKQEKRKWPQTPYERMRLRESELLEEIHTLRGSNRVILRILPERSNDPCLFIPDEYTVVVCTSDQPKADVPGSLTIPSLNKAYSFEKILGPDVNNNEMIFAEFSPIILSLFHGYNGCILCMERNSFSEESNVLLSGDHSDNAGIVSRSLDLIFECIDFNDDFEYTLEMSVFDVRFDTVVDILHVADTPEEASGDSAHMIVMDDMESSFLEQSIVSRSSSVDQLLLQSDESSSSRMSSLDLMTSEPLDESSSSAAASAAAAAALNPWESMKREVDLNEYIRSSSLPLISTPYPVDSDVKSMVTENVSSSTSIPVSNNRSVCVNLQEKDGVVQFFGAKRVVVKSRNHAMELIRSSIRQEGHSVKENKSHMVITFVLAGSSTRYKTEFKSTLSIVDMASRVKNPGASDEQQHQVNKDYAALGKVLNALALRSKKRMNASPSRQTTINSLFNAATTVSSNTSSMSSDMKKKREMSEAELERKKRIPIEFMQMLRQSKSQWADVVLSSKWFAEFSTRCDKGDHHDVDDNNGEKGETLQSCIGQMSSVNPSQSNYSTEQASGVAMPPVVRQLDDSSLSVTIVPPPTPSRPSMNIIPGSPHRLNPPVDTSFSHIPFRDCKLTFLLKNALTGHAKTAVLISVSPDMKDGASTINSLEFASLASNAEVGVIHRSRRDLNISKLKEQLREKDKSYESLVKHYEQLRSAKKGSPSLSASTAVPKRHSLPVKK